MPHRGRGAPGGALWIVLLAPLLAALARVPAQAEAADDVYTVARAKVQASGARPEIARAKAVADGEAVALGRLLRKLTLAEDHARLPKPDAEAVRAAVRDFSVESENQQGDKYTASIAYRFDREAVRAMLEAAGVPFVDATSPPLVVLPVWREEGKPTLWDDPNPWREAWMRHEPEDSLVQFARPRGDLADLKAISGEEAAAGNRAALNRIADHYKAGLIVVAAGTVEKGQRRIAVQLYDLANGRTAAVGTFAAAGTDAAGLDQAAAQIARAIDAAWKKSAVAVEQNAIVVRIRAPLQGLEHWIKIRRALTSLPQLRSLTTVSMSPGEALIELRFAGTMAELRRQLEQKDMALTAEPASGGPEVWLLKPPATTIKETELPPAPETPPGKSDRPKDGERPKEPQKKP